MSDTGETKAILQHYLQVAREALVWKLDGLSEREARLPRTPTGTNLLGIVKHCANVEAGYFGMVFDRSFPTPDDLVPVDAFESDPQADWYATEDETLDGLVDLYRRVWAFSDETIEQLPLDAPGRVPWWGDRGDVTLHQIMIHVVDDIARHAGHADILREQIDGSVGLKDDNTNIPDELDWAAYVDRLTEIADRFA